MNARTRRKPNSYLKLIYATELVNQYNSLYLLVIYQGYPSLLKGSYQPNKSDFGNGRRARISPVNLTYL